MGVGQLGKNQKNYFNFYVIWKVSKWKVEKLVPCIDIWPTMGIYAKKIPCILPCKVENIRSNISRQVSDLAQLYRDYGLKLYAD